MSNVFCMGTHTESAGTAITEVIPAVSQYIPRITSLSYKNSTTEHTLSIMRSCGKTTASAAAASGTSALVLTSVDPGLDMAGADESLAAGDWVVWKCEHGQWHGDSIASVSISTNTITLDNALPDDVDMGANIWTFYEPGRYVHVQIKLPVSTTTEISSINLQGGYPQHIGKSHERVGQSGPLLVHVDNITAAGTLLYCSGHYVSTDSKVMG